MSASQEKMRRREEKSSGPNKKDIEIAKKAKENKKRKTITILVIAVFVLLAAFAIFFSSSALYSNFTAVKMNGTEFSICEFNYYYYESYNQYQSMVGQISESISNGSSIVESANQLKHQVMDEETGETYGEYFTDLGVSLMKETMASYDEAVKAGYELPQEKLDEIDATITSLDTYASYLGYSHANGYLASIYGKGMTTETFKELLIRDETATAYKEYVEDSYQYDDDVVWGKYEDEKDEYDTFNMRSFYFDGKGGLDDPTEETMAAALELAEEFESKITDEQSFLDLCVEYASEEEKENYMDEDYTIRNYIGKGLVSYYKDWLTDESRKEGDTYIAEAVNGYYVLYFISRDDNSYNTHDVYVLELEVASVEEADYETTAEYEEAVQKMKDTAEESTNTLYQGWLDDGGTAEAFKEMSVYASADASDGYNPNVNKYSLDTIVSDWVFDPSREEGDSDILYCEDHNAYYIVYYVQESVPYAYHQALTDLQKEAYYNWYEDLMANYPEAEFTWFAKFVG